MAELLAANQITIAKVLDGEQGIPGEKGADGEMSAEQLAQLNQASEDASQAKSDVANLEIGGRNYVLKTDEFSSTKNGITVDYDGDVYHIYGTNTKTDVAYSITQFVNRANVFEPGAVYTVSTTTPLPSGLYVGINTRNSSGTEIVAASNSYFPGDGSKTSNTFTCTQDTNGELRGFFGVYAYCGTVDVTFKIKLEKGNKATDWTPAPEDVDAGIDNAQTQADKAYTKAKDVELTKIDRFGTNASMKWDGNVLKIEAVDPETNVPYAVEIGGNGIEFKYDNEAVAMINQDQLVIDKTVVLTEMQVNRYWTWRTRDNNNLCLQWIGGSN